MVLPSVMNRAVSRFKASGVFETAKEQVITTVPEENARALALKVCKQLGYSPDIADKAMEQLYRGNMDSKKKEQASVDTVVTVVVMLLVAAILVPIALQLLGTANTTGWSTTNITIFGLLGTIAMVAIILKFLRQVKET